ncbi:MAG: hypothetical protein JSW52_03540 [Candidatus Coatesbacteria bacterium]|nr:MAG: hypothetical protein JSW52_03540 [Candidatus Coatesbacteria bacterium]
MISTLHLLNYFIAIPKKLVYNRAMSWKKPISLTAIVSLICLSVMPAASADLRVLSEDGGAEVYAGVKLLGTTPLLIEDCRPGEMTLSLAGGPDFALDVPDDNRTVTVFLNVEPEKGLGALGTTGKWIFVGAIAGGIAAIVIVGKYK